MLGILIFGAALNLFVANGAVAATYSTDITPSQSDICRDLSMAFIITASVNQASPSIELAKRLYNNAIGGCRLNPRESIRKLETALHLVTPL